MSRAWLFLRVRGFFEKEYHLFEFQIDRVNQTESNSCIWLFIYMASAFKRHLSCMRVYWIWWVLAQSGAIARFTILKKNNQKAWYISDPCHASSEFYFEFKIELINCISNDHILSHYFSLSPSDRPTKHSFLLSLIKRHIFPVSIF